MTHTRPPTPVGRGELLERASADLAAGSVLLFGPAGIGKSTVLDALAAQADPESVRVLRAAAAEAEAELPYLALVDLFDTVGDDVVAALPAHLRATLDGALLRSALPATPQDQLAVRLAVLELLRTLAVRQMVLLVLDDVQWIDEPSAGVLRFAARRLDGANVRVLAAERVAEGGTPTQAALCPPPHTEVAVPPLTEVHVGDILRARFGAGLPRGRLARVHEVSGGNPLYAVELGRALLERGGGLARGPLPVPDRLRSLLAERVGRLGAGGRPVLLAAALAARPTLALLTRAGFDPAGLDEGVASGVVTAATDGAVRFSHPLLREMVEADAEPARRREVHARLAGAVTDPVERARHLAAAHLEPDELLAETLAEAASAARLRGAPGTAADLAALAADRTPVDSPGLAAQRRLTAAQYALSAGRPDDAELHANASLRDAADRRTLVEARLLLVELAGQDQSGIGPLLDAAFTDAGDATDLLARVRFYRAQKAFYDHDPGRSLQELSRAEEAAEDSGDVESLIEILRWRGKIVGGSEGDEYIERAGKLAEDLPPTIVSVGARQIAAIRQMLRGNVAEAVGRIETLRAAVERGSGVRELAYVLWATASVYTRAGRCAEALAAGRYCARLFAEVMPSPGPGLVVGALAEVYGGTAERALEAAEEAIEACLADGDEDWLRGAYAAAGIAQMLTSDPHAAAVTLRRAYEAEMRTGFIEPAAVLWHADLVEALVAIGARDEAAAVLGEIRTAADRLQRTVAHLGLDRAEAALIAATEEPRDGAAFLRDSLNRWADHPFPLETARAWHALGVLERRAHRRGAAREALTEALRRYTSIGAAPWQEAAQAELARLDGGRGAGLSDTERRIVELVRAGATNREIARSLFLSIKAVEANLTRLYRRLGVRNRAQLARALDTVPPR